MTQFDPHHPHFAAIPVGKPLDFQHATTPGQRYTVLAVGDILLHEHIQRWVAKQKNFRFLWEPFIPIMQKADITYANLEGPMAFGVDQEGRLMADPGLVYDGMVYTGYPRFNYFPCLAEDLVKSGVNVVSTANNHSLDRHGIGVDRTIEVLRQAGLSHTGTRSSWSNHDEAAWVAVVAKNGLTTAWIGCTYGTNEIPDPDNQVLFWPGQSDTLNRLVATWKNVVDAVFVTPHWGDEDEPRILTSQVQLAHELLENGALAVIGNHPHLVQPMERYLTHDGRETLVIYSLGNFVSAQLKVWQRATVLLSLSLTKTLSATHISGVSFIPAYMNNDRHVNNPPTLQPICSSHEYGQDGLTHILTPLAREHWLEFDVAYRDAFIHF